MTNLEKILDDSIAKVKDFPKKGILFYDITSLLLKPSVLNLIIENLYDYYSNSSIDGIIAVESRGFIFASPLCLKFNIPLILARKKGKLPRATISESYSLEYGQETIEIHKEDIVKGMKKNFKGSEEAMYAIATSKAKKVAETIVKKLKETLYNPGEMHGEYEIGDIVTYKGEDHEITRIEPDRIYIRPAGTSMIGKLNHFWVKREDLND